MQFKVLADEDVDFRIVTALKNSGYEVISVLREHQGIGHRTCKTFQCPSPD